MDLRKNANNKMRILLRKLLKIIRRQENSV